MDARDNNKTPVADINEKDMYYYKGGRIFATPPAGDEVVISGISGEFPNSKDIYEFRENLFNKVNMLTPNWRWKHIYPELPPFSGKVPEINKYDSGFFGVHERQSQCMDMMTRIIQEKTVEAIFDAGLHPSELEETRTGVYIGSSYNEVEKVWLHDNLSPPTFLLTGTEKSMIAHRLSYFLKLRGPSYSLDAACSSSLHILEDAYRAIRLGEIDNAIVGGMNMCLHPGIPWQFTQLGALSKDGTSKPFDIDGTGFVRSEAFVVTVLQKAKDAKRIYAQIVHVKTNSDGYKEQGITFPSTDGQVALMNDFYAECDINKQSLTFIEAHGTGTTVGDPVECGAIDRVLSRGRQKPLLIGSVKSNMGHSEAASGLCSVVKCILAVETGYIPPNINFNTPKNDITGLIDGRMKVVVDKTPLEEGDCLMAISNFGMGGTNAHLLLKRNPKKKVRFECNLPILGCISGRTQEAVNTLLNQIDSNKRDFEYLRLLQQIFRKNIPNHLYRGYNVVTECGTISKSVVFCPDQGKPLYLIFGELDNWCEVGKQLIILPAFSQAIERIQQNVITEDINITNIFLENNLHERNPISVVGTVIVQMAIVEVLNLLDVKRDCCIGWGLGRLASDYCNRVLTLEETVNYAFVINEILLNTNEPQKRVSEGSTLSGSTRDELLDQFQSTPENIKMKTIEYLLMKHLPNINRIKATNYIQSYLLGNKSYKIENSKLDSVIFEIGSCPPYNSEDVSIISLFEEDGKSYLVEFLAGLGRLYASGYDPQISRLYPQINFPVSRGTPMISPYIRWNHSRDQFVPQYSLDSDDGAIRGIKTYKVQMDDEKWKFISGYVLEGNETFFPTAGCIYMVWETFVLMKSVSLETSRVSFENCRFLKAVSVPSKNSIVFRVSIQGNGNFEVTEGSSLVFTGQINCLPDNETKIYDDSELSELVKSQDLYLDSTDIYKEMRLRGLNFRGNFYGIQECDVSFSRGYLKWEENWITFIDSLFQIKFLNIDTRSLCVPIFISKLEIDIDMHYQLLKKITKGLGEPTNLMFYNNNTTGRTRCGGLTATGFTVTSVARKQNPRTPILESYEFIPNTAKLDTHTSVRVNMQIILENSLVRSIKAVELVDEFTENDSELLTPIIMSALKDEPLVQPNIKVLSAKDLDVDVVVENESLENESKCLLVVVSKISSRPEIFNLASTALKEHGFILSRENHDCNITHVRDDFAILTVHRSPSETILLLKKQSVLRKDRCIKINTLEDFSWLPEVQDALKNNLNENLILYSEKESTNGILGMLNCLRKEPGRSNVRGVFIMDESEAFHPTCSRYKYQLEKNMAINVYKNGQWGTYRHLPLHNLKTVESEHCCLNIAAVGNLSSLRWTNGPLKHYVIPEKGKELVYVYYSSINLQDVLIATGKINVELLTPNRLEHDFVLGCEFSGRDQRGKRVMGLAAKGALSNLVLADPLFIHDVPDEWTLEEAATVPFVYTTVIYALIMRGEMKKGDHVLIHSDAGSVNQAAIRLAFHYGCEVFTTVDTEVKRKFLLKVFPQLKDKHIGTAYNETFQQMVFRETNGKGVDLVFNCLSEEKLTASMKCLRRGGRCLGIEILDMARNNYFNLLLLVNETSFHGIVLDKIFDAPLNVKSEINKLFKELMRAGAIKPLNTIVYEHGEIEQAFKHIENDMPIEKVLIKIREPEEQRIILPSIQKMQPLPRYLCDPLSVYIIVGGLGGFGLELADWLVLRGARKLMLISRNGISSGYQCYRTRLWESYGITMKISQTSIATKKGCRQIIEEAQQIGHIAAIFNLAMVLVDSALENQSPESFTTCFIPKAFATKHLDDLTREMCPDLRDFVVFSSVSCGRGNAEQTNYGMANSAMERICEKRKRDGYPALAIQWGAVGEVGFVSNLRKDHFSDLEIGGNFQQPISNCLHVLDIFLTQNDCTIVGSRIVADKSELLSMDNVVDAVINIIGIKDLKYVSVTTTLAELGMDSLLANQIRQVLERDFEISVSETELRVMTIERLQEIQKSRDGIS